MPPEQEMHVDEPDDDENVPAGHIKHVDELARDDVPGGQSVHPDALTVPAFVTVPA